MRSNNLLHALTIVATATCLAMPIAAHAQAISYTSGVINSDGSTHWGHGFTSQHLGTGDYQLSFSAGAFPLHAPVFTCSPLGLNPNATICVIRKIIWHTTSPSTAEIKFYARTDGSLQDNGFDFTEMTAN